MKEGGVAGLFPGQLAAGVLSSSGEQECSVRLLTGVAAGAELSIPRHLLQPYNGTPIHALLEIHQLLLWSFSSSVGTTAVCYLLSGQGVGEVSQLQLGHSLEPSSAEGGSARCTRPSTRQLMPDML